VPLIITDQAPWIPWLREYPLVRRQAVWAAQHSAMHFAVSQSLRQTIVEITGQPDRVQVMPNVVDGDVFYAPPGVERVRDQILWVGVVRHVKGVDVLLRAMLEVRRRRPGARLVLAGDAFHAAYRREETHLRQMAQELGVSDCVEWIGGQSPLRVAQLMSASSVVVLPSRRETFGAVLIEALACGTPVVSTSSGGPDDVVTPDVGRLVPTEDPAALANALVDVLERQSEFDPNVLRGSALARYGVPVIAARLARAYDAALSSAQKPKVALGGVHQHGVD
jgi:glycosyltransferase involved in cell wall biosynthesis